MPSGQHFMGITVYNPVKEDDVREKEMSVVKPEPCS